MNIREYNTYHTTRNLAKHALELDDKLYGSPIAKTEIDWPLLEPEKYLNILEIEKKLLLRNLEDFVYVLREKEIFITYRLKNYSLEDANAHIYHKFTHRTFNYVEKVCNSLQSNYSPNDIDINVGKARRQLNAILAALNDIDVSIIRFQDYLKNIQKEE